MFINSTTPQFTSPLPLRPPHLEVVDGAQLRAANVGSRATCQDTHNTCALQTQQHRQFGTSCAWRFYYTRSWTCHASCRRHPCAFTHTQPTNPTTHPITNPPHPHHALTVESWLHARKHEGQCARLALSAPEAVGKSLNVAGAPLLINISLTGQGSVRGGE